MGIHHFTFYLIFKTERSKFIYIKYFTLKACIHYEPTERPSAWAIINFIENKCHVFASEEREEYEIICEELEN